MGRKKQENPNDYLVAIELIKTTKELIQDPLISTLIAWYWIEKKSGLGWDDRTALRLGVIDINGARAKVDNSIVMSALSQVTGLAGDLATGLGIAKGGPAGMITAGASQAVKKRSSRSSSTSTSSTTIGQMTVEDAIQKGVLQYYDPNE